MPNYRNNKNKPNRGFGDSSHAIMDGILEEIYEDNYPPYSNYGFYSMEEEPELIDCSTNVIGPNRDLFDFIKEHDCFLNLPEVDID